MQSCLFYFAMLLVSSLAAGVSPSWTRDAQIDSGELKAVNFELILAGNFTGIVTANKSVTGYHHYNKTNFGGTPRVIVGMKSYGIQPMSAFTALDGGFRFTITSRNATNLTYSLTTFGITIVALHYQYLAVLGYDNLYYMQFYALNLNATNAVYNSSAGLRTDSFTLANPSGYVTGPNYSSAQMVLQVWPYYFRFTPTASALSFNTSALATSTTNFVVTVSADSGCVLLEVGISVLYLNKTQIFANTYSQFVDYSNQIITGSDLAGSQITTTMDNTTAQYQFRSSEEGVQGVYLPFSAVGSITVWYFSATSTNVSKLYYIAIQERVRVCPNTSIYFLVDDQLCYSQCPSLRYATNTTYNYCKKCHYSCLQCSSADISTACTSCNASAARTLTNSSCLCNFTYFDNGTQPCPSCHYTCLTCNNNIATACLSCDSGLHRVITNNTCLCTYGFYQNTTCFACVNQCIQCSYSSSNQTYACLACNASLFMQVDSGQQTCVCMNGYYNSTNNTCAKCIDGCLTCTDGLTCNTCDIANHWETNITDNTCKCTNHFFVSTVNSSKSCLQCDSTCLTCSSSLSTACTLCDSAINRVLANSSCVCTDGFYQNITCIGCINHCTVCSYSPSNQSYACLACNSSLLEVLDAAHTSCICQLGYYNSSGLCLACMAGCTDCSDGTTCNNCNVTQHWIKDANNTCVCDNHYFFVNSSSTCDICDSTCLACINANTICLSCDSSLHRAISNNTCPCNDGFYENITCIACKNLCTRCSYTPFNQTYTCVACNSSLFMQVDLSQQACVCIGGYYNNSNACSKCIDGCSACTNGVSCDTCDAGNHWISNATDNTCQCANSFFLVMTNGSKSCSACHSTCLTCISSSSTCLSCDSSAHRSLTNSSCPCQAGFYQNSTCLACINNCIECSFTSGNQTYLCTKCDSNYQLNSTSCVLSSLQNICGNGVIDGSEQCDDGNTNKLDGCSDACKVQVDHTCLNNITTVSVCYYNGSISLLHEDTFKVPLQNKVSVRLFVSAPNCNPTYLKQYLEHYTSIELISATRRVLAASDIVSQSVTYDPATSIANINFEYNQDIDLTKKQVKFVASQSYVVASSKYFFASPSTAITLSAPDNLLLTTYSSSSDISNAKTISYVFAAMIGLMWLFWLISICYHQTASAIEFMLVVQVAYEALLQRKFITDGWIGLVLYGKYLYGYNVDYSTPAKLDRLQVLSLNAYLFHTINITTALLLLTVVIILAILCYETVKVVSQERKIGDLNMTQAKIETSMKNDDARDEESQYKIKKGIALVLFEIGTSFTLLTVKIVVISLMLVTAATAIDAAIVSTILAVCYFLVWFFNYKYSQNEFLDDFSFKRILRDLQDPAKRRSFSAKVGNAFVKYYYLFIFFLLIGFGVIDGLPSFGALFNIVVLAASLAFLLMMVVFGVYFRSAHTVRAACNLIALAGVMVLHLLQSLQVDRPSQSLTGPIICLCLLYTSFVVNFGLMTYIQIRRHRNSKPKYRNAKVAPADPVIQFNYTEEPQLPPEHVRQMRKETEEEVEVEVDVRRSNHSGESLINDSKFETLRSKSRENSLGQTHKKLAVPRPQSYGETKQKAMQRNEDEFVVIRSKVENLFGQEVANYEDNSDAQRIDVVDLGRSVSDFTKTKPILNGRQAFMEQADEGTNKKTI